MCVFGNVRFMVSVASDTTFGCAGGRGNLKGDVVTVVVEKECNDVDAVALRGEGREQGINTRGVSKIYNKYSSPDLSRKTRHEYQCRRCTIVNLWIHVAFYIL